MHETTMSVRWVYSRKAIRPPATCSIMSAWRQSKALSLFLLLMNACSMRTSIWSTAITDGPVNARSREMSRTISCGVLRVCRIPHLARSPGSSSDSEDRYVTPTSCALKSSEANRTSARAVSWTSPPTRGSKRRNASTKASMVSLESGAFPISSWREACGRPTREDRRRRNILSWLSPSTSRARLSSMETTTLSQKSLASSRPTRKK